MDVIFETEGAHADCAQETGWGRLRLLRLLRAP